MLTMVGSMNQEGFLALQSGEDVKSPRLNLSLPRYQQSTTWQRSQAGLCTGADVVTIDGFRGGTGAAPMVIRDNVGIPIELALAAADQRLRDEGIRNNASIICAGGIRSSGDMAKAIALGADAVVIGTAALVALGCRICQKCYTGNCVWGMPPERLELVRRLDPQVGSERLTNLLTAWSLELKEIPGLARRELDRIPSR